MTADLTLTPNESLARLLRQRQTLAAAEHQEVWVDPQVHSFTRWVRDQWLQCWPDRQLLHPLAERLVWTSIVTDAPEARHLIQPDALVPLAQQAAALAVRYRIDPASGNLWQLEHRVFARWFAQFRERLRDSGWITTADLPYALADHIASGDIPLPAAVDLHGWWHPLTPDQQHVLAALHRRGCAIRHAPAPVPRCEPTFRRYPGRDDELAGLGVALRGLLDDGTESIIIAVDNPDAQRPALEAALSEYVAPWRFDPAVADEPPPWRFESPPPLLEQPAVQVALRLLELKPRGNSLPALSAVLLSPVLWPAAWRRVTAAVEYRLRETGMQFQAPDLSRHLPGDAPAELDRRLQLLADSIGSSPTRAPLSDWVEHWRRRLEAAAWAERVDPALAAALQDALTALGTLSAMAGRCDTGQALQQLRRMLATTRHSAPLPAPPPIRIMDLETAASMPCDVLHVVGMHDQVLPARRTPTTLIEPELLQAAGVAGATPAARLEHARRLAHALGANAAAVHVSGHAVDEAGADLLPAAVLAPPARWQDAPASAPLPARATLLRGPDPVPPVLDPRHAALRGGTGIFKSYFEAPFFAFCKARLGVESRPLPLRGLPASEQGRLIHAVLEALWRDHLHDQAGLAAVPAAELRALVAAQVERLLPRHMPAFRYPRTSIALEQQRVIDVCCQWLAHERRRVDPFRVIAFEQRASITLAGLPLNVVIDRVDRVDTPLGPRYLILDYKTGNTVSAGGWKVEKMEEPQLPLYASCDVLDAALVPHADGIAFGHVVDGRPALVAATNWRERLIEDSEPRPSPDWDDTLLQWRERLLGAAADLLGGAAGLDASRSYDRSFNAPLLALAGDIDANGDDDATA